MTEHTAPGTFDDLWRRAVAQGPDAPFLLFEDVAGQTSTWSYAQMDDLVSRAAHRLSENGLAAGGSVHLVLQNSPVFVTTWLAASRLGAWIVPADPAATATELADHISRTRPAVAAVARKRASIYTDACACLPHTSGTPAPAMLFLTETADDLAPDSPLHSRSTLTATTSVTPEDRLAVMFTSGTTSAPKGVLLSQGLYAHTAHVMAAAASLDAAHRWLVTLPLFHANAQYYCLDPAIAAGASVAVTARFSASQWVSQARRLETTHASMFAAPIRMVLDRTSDRMPLDLKHLWFAQNLTPDEHAALGKLAGVEPRQIYGMTETGPAVLSNPADDPVSASLGTVTPGCQVRLGASDPDEVGHEIEVGGIPGRSLFGGGGYLDDPEATDRATYHTEEGTTWLRTGDRATRDEGGYFYFRGRGTDIVKVGGENVSLTEVEAALRDHPGVNDLVAAALPDPVLEEVVGVLVVPHSETFDADAFTQWATHQVGPSRSPRAVVVTDELPRTSVGKVRRFLAQEQLLNRPTSGHSPDGAGSRAPAVAPRPLVGARCEWSPARR